MYTSGSGVTPVNASRSTVIAVNASFGYLHREPRFDCHRRVCQRVRLSPP